MQEILDTKSKILFNNETIVTEGNIGELIKLALAQVEDFWSVNKNTKKFSRKIKVILVNKNSKMTGIQPELVNGLRHIPSRSVFYSPVSEKIFINTQTFKDLIINQIGVSYSAIIITMMLLHESAHHMQKKCIIPSFMIYGDVTKPYFGLHEDVADMMCGVFLFYLEGKGKLERDDKDKSRDLHIKTGADSISHVSQFIDRAMEGHGSSEIREKNFLRGYELAKRLGVNEAIELTMDKMRV